MHKSNKFWWGNKVVEYYKKKVILNTELYNFSTKFNIPIFFLSN